MKASFFRSVKSGEEIKTINFWLMITVLTVIGEFLRGVKEASKTAAKTLFQDRPVLKVECSAIISWW